MANTNEVKKIKDIIDDYVSLDFFEYAELNAYQRCGIRSNSGHGEARTSCFSYKKTN
jgi:hypothetical protein